MQDCKALINIQNDENTTCSLIQTIETVTPPQQSPNKNGDDSKSKLCMHQINTYITHRQYQ